MASKNSTKKGEALVRVNTRIFERQDAFIKSEAKRSKGDLTEGDVTRQLLDEGISNHKSV